MWRGHQAVQSSMQRWLPRLRRDTFVGTKRYSSRYLSCAVSYAAAEKILLRQPSIPSAAFPLLERQRHVNAHNQFFSTRQRRVPQMRDLQSVEEVIKTAYDYLNVMSRRNISAVWSRLAQLMTKRQPKQRGNPSNKRADVSFEDMEHMLNTIFDDTKNGLGNCGPRELTETTLGMVRIVKVLQQQRTRSWDDGSRVILRRLLLDNKGVNANIELFQFLAEKAKDELHRFDARCLANVAYAYALIKYIPDFDDGSDLFDYIGTEAVAVKTEFKSQELANILWACATVNKPQYALFEVLGDEICALKHLNDFKPQALSNTVWAYATADISHPKLFEKMANHIVESHSLDQFVHPQDFSNTVWAYATAGAHHPKLFEKVANHIVKFDSLDRFKPQELSNTVWAYATAGVDHPTLFEKVANHIVKCDSLDRFKPQEIKDIVWAYATAGAHHPKLFEKVANHIVKSDSLDRFKPQELSNTVWAYATADERHPMLFEKMADHIVESKSLNLFKPQNFSNTVWAYATAGAHHPKLFEKLANHIIFKSDSLDRFKPQELSNAVWAYATANAHHPTLFEKMANHIVKSENLDRFEPQNFSNTVWAYATANAHHPTLFEKVANHIIKSDSLDRFKPQALKDTVWAYATANAHHPKLLEKVANHIVKSDSLDRFKPQALSNTIWAYATLGVIDRQLFSSFASTAAKNIDSFNNHELANIAWAFAVANVDSPTLFNDNFINMCIQKKDGFNINALRQLYQWHLWQTKEKSRDGLPEELLDSCNKAFISADTTASKFQKDVVTQLTLIGLDPKEEVLLDSGYSIDAVIEVNGKTVGVEVDGPSHFIGSSKSPTGSTIMKRRQVPSIDGIELASVPGWEWRKLGNDETKKQEYLRKLLDFSS